MPSDATSVPVDVATLPPFSNHRSVCTRDSQSLVDGIEPDEFLFLIHGVSWEQPFYVVAKSVQYTVTG